MIDIEPSSLEIAKKILAKYVPDAKVIAFGSRVKFDATKYSDLDLAVIANVKLSRKTLDNLSDAFIESDIPFRVDIIDWHRISDTFQKIILAQYVVLQQKKTYDPL